MTPEIRIYNGKQVLFVDDAPFYAVAGEVHNSDSSSLTYMEGIWKIADDLGLNTLLLPVTWELVEPEEGHFDFTIPDGLIAQARKWNKRIVFLWFGSWKNAEMMYAPAWVKKDVKRFKRAEIVKGNLKALRGSGMMQMPYYSLSYLCEESMHADAKAFATWMAHLKQIDQQEATVIGVQVENETGLLGNAREVSDEADAVFESPVPEAFITYFKEHTSTMHEDVKEVVESCPTQGTWKEVFGPLAEEIFSAYHISKYVNYVAEAGLKEYKLPTFANCWLDVKDKTPGNYPSGGPVSRMHEVWHYCAPSINVLCPDIYVPEFLDVCDDYSKHQALFIPEAATHSYAVSRLVYCIGHYHAMGYSPFGFDDIGKPFTLVQGFLFGMDVEDPALKTPQNFEEYAWFAKTLTAMMPILAPKYGTPSLQAVCAETKEDVSVMDFGKIKFTVVFRHPYLSVKENGVVLAVQCSEEDYYIVGHQAAFSIQQNGAEHFDILELEEGTFKDGKWYPGRRLNGDEAAFIPLDTPHIYRFKIHTYNNI